VAGVSIALLSTQMQKKPFAPGFRLSVVDLIILVIGAVAALALFRIVWWWGFVVGFALAHFFLFCNVVRMARPLELAWSSVFVALAAATVALDAPGWLMTTCVSLLVTVVVVLLEVRKPSYHGVGWRRINPELPAWWAAQTAEDGG